MKFFRYNVNYDFLRKITRYHSKIDVNSFHKKTLGDFFFFGVSCQPTEADYFLVPLPIILPPEHSRVYDLWIQDYLSTLEHLNEKHIFFLMGDGCIIPDPLKKYIVFQTSCHKDNSSYSMYYNSPLDKIELKDIHQAKYKFCFVGNCKVNPLRQRIKEIFHDRKDCYFEEADFHFMNEQQQEKARIRWQEVLNDSQFVLCPKGRGLNSIRFFEALAYQRIPILISDDLKLPLENIIDYDKYCVRLKENEMQFDLDIDIDNYQTGIYEKYFVDIYRFIERNLYKIF